MSAQARQAAPITAAEAVTMLGYAGGATDRDDWLRVGRALKREFGEALFGDWVFWSECGGKYDAAACRVAWKGLHKGDGVGIGTLVYLAKAGGWTRGVVARELSQQELTERAELATARREAALEAAAHDDAAAAVAAVAQWRAAARVGVSAYAERKQIAAPESVRYTAEGALLVPMIRYDLEPAHALKGLQTIHADGSKRFTPGMAKAGCACRLGPSVVAARAPIFVVEGYATGMTIRAALAAMGKADWPVFVAFDAGNLVLVTQALIELYKLNPLVICADDDHKTMVGDLPRNVGRVKADAARELAADAGAAVAVTYPVFGAGRGVKDTDFNDLAALEGLGEVKTQLCNVLYALSELIGVRDGC